MTYKIMFSAIDDYLHVAGIGKETLENVICAWKEIGEACRQHGRNKILCEGLLKGPGPVLDIYAFGELFRTLGIPTGAKIAVVCKQEELQKIQFADNVVATRASVQSRVFLDRDAAIAWLENWTAPQPDIGAPRTVFPDNVDT